MGLGWGITVGIGVDIPAGVGGARVGGARVGGARVGGARVGGLGTEVVEGTTVGIGVAGDMEDPLRQRDATTAIATMINARKIKASFFMELDHLKVCHQRDFLEYWFQSGKSWRTLPPSALTNPEFSLGDLR